MKFKIPPKFTKNLVIIILFIILYLYIANNLGIESKKVSIVWVNLEKETYKDSLEYDHDIKLYLQKNNFSIFDGEDRFLQLSLSKLNKVDLQQNISQSISFLLSNAISIDSGYSVLGSNDRFNLSIYTKYNDCYSESNFTNIYESEFYNITENFIESFANCLYNILTKQKTNHYLFVGNDHGLSYLTFKIAKKLAPESKIGLFVFDEHVDIYGLKDKDNVVNKANVFGKLILEGYVDYVVFIGHSEIAKSNYQNSVQENFTRKDLFNKIEVYSDKDIAGYKWRRLMSRSMSNMKKEGITNIMVSIDIDVLPTEYTGFEYSILAPAISKIRFGANRSDITLAEVPEGFSKGLDAKDLRNYIKHIRNEAILNNIKYGVYRNETLLIGDVQELLTKQDFNMETTKAVKKIITYLSR